MSLLSIGLKAEAEAARRALYAAGKEKGEIWLAVHRAADCAADLDRAERLLDSERASAEAARAALDRALQLFEIEAEQQRRRDEAAEEAAIRAASGSAGARGYMPNTEGCAEFAADLAPAKRRKKGESK